ncbi:MAG: hypothetical protein OXE58_08745 [Acidobacteria bacterium]|nr:hypothetical protein [Acidobacteriota bacterium]
MKTAISVPDELFREADDFAKRTGTSRSRLYSDAVSEYLARRRHEEITAKLNEVLAEEPNRLDPVLARIQAASIGPDEW